MNASKIKVGDQVVIEMTYASPLLANVFQDIPKTKTFRGQVLPSTDYDPLDSVRITSDDPMVDLRVIQFRNIRSWNGESFDYQSQTQRETKKPEYVIVQGSGGKTYTVTKKVDGSLSCNCPGYGFRGRCKHVDQIKNG